MKIMYSFVHNLQTCRFLYYKIRLKAERVKYWLSVGAEPTDRVKIILGMAALIPQAPTHRSIIKCIPKAERKQSFGTFTAGNGLIGSSTRVTFHPFCVLEGSLW
jgi:hypothetical protein